MGLQWIGPLFFLYHITKTIYQSNIYMNTRSKIRKYNPVIELDESGALVLFTLPFAALYYDMACVKLKEQDKVDDVMDLLIEKVFLMNEN